MKIGESNNEKTHLFKDQEPLCGTTVARAKVTVEPENVRDWMVPAEFCDSCLFVSSFVFLAAPVTTGSNKPYSFHLDPECMYLSQAENKHDKIFPTTADKAHDSNKTLCKRCAGKVQRDSYEFSTCGICGKQVKKLPQHLEFEHLSNDI